nr:hypothetical protein [Tanacetum cinerariifolium]
MMTDRDSSATGTDNRPPMLEEDDFESWKIRMERYIRGKTNGKYMWKAIQTGNSPRPQVTDQPTEAVPHPIAREKTDDEYTDAENLKEQFDIQFPLTNNQLRASSNPRSQATVQAGQIVTETVQRSASGNVGKQGNRENQANGSKVVCYNYRGEGKSSRYGGRSIPCRCGMHNTL